MRQQEHLCRVHTTDQLITPHGANSNITGTCVLDAKDPQDALPYHQVGHVHVPTSEMCKHAAQDRLSRTLSWTCCTHDVVNVNTHIGMHDIY